MNRTRARRLRFLLAPLLLLVLGVAKWHADHPPLSQADRLLAALVASEPEASIFGNGGAAWTRITGLHRAQCLMVNDTKILRHLVESLRCEDRWVPKDGDILFGPDLIEVSFPLKGDGLQDAPFRGFVYFRDQSGAYISRAEDMDRRDGMLHCMVVRPRSVARFEAAMADLAQRAQAPGPHPEITVSSSP